MALSSADLQTVYSLLSNALSPDESARKPAESTLSQCENRPGFSSCLLEIIAARGVGCRDDVRLLASLYFKNSINRYWRNRRESPGITNEEKSHIRNKLLLYLREDNTQIAVQLAVLVAKIARADYPKEWPELFSVLAQQLQSADTLASHRVLMALFRTLKELSTKRLTSDLRVFQEITSSLFEYSWNFWKNDIQKILQSFFNISQSVSNSVEQEQDLVLVCERWLLCLKIIRQMITSGYPSDSTSVQEVQLVKEVCPMLLSAVQSFLPYYASFMERQVKLWDFIKRACVKLMKVLVAIQMKHPYSFSDQSVLPPLVDFSLNNITNPEPIAASFEQFLIQCMVLLKSVLECKEYKPTLTGRVINHVGESMSFEERKQRFSIAAADMLKTVLPSERITLLCNVLIRRYFIFTAKDIDEWYQNPESFHHDQDMVQWTEKLRPCAEALFIVLFENHRNLLGPVVVSILHEASSGSPPSEFEITPAMLLKDAAYSAAGHVYYELSNYLNFSDWFNGSLAIELANDHPNMRIIHRKIAFVLGQWVSEIKDDTRKQVYHALVRLLQENDIAVRLAACRSLCHLVEQTNVSELGFLELLPSCWTQCFKLMEEVQEFDSKVQVLNWIHVLVEHAGERIVPYASQLSNFFYKIWEESNGESLLQIQLLAAFQKLVCSLGFQSSMCYNVLLPILRSGIDINNPDSLNLLEDGLQLWEATLSNAPSVSQLLDFFPYLVAILERNFDHLQVAINIFDDYIIFGGKEFMERHSSSLAKILDGIVGNVNDKALISTLPVIDLLIQCFPMEAPPLLCGVLQKLVLLCLSGEDDHLATKTRVRTLSAAILARVLVMNSNYFAQLASEPFLSMALQQAGVSISQNLLLAIADVWVDKIDNANSLQKKSYALALSVILTLRMPEVIDKLDDIISVCTSVIMGGTEEISEEDSSSETTSSVANSNDNGFAGMLSKESKRRQIKESDQMKKLSLEDMLKENLKTCAAVHGEVSFNAAIGRIHPSAFAQLQQALKMA